MKNRQSGVAHVSILWVLVVIVLFLGAGMFAYFQTTELQRQRQLVAHAEQAKRDADAQRLFRVEQLQEVTNLIGLSGRYASADGSQETDRFTSPALLKAQLDQVRTSFGVSGTTLADLVDPIRRRYDDRAAAIAKAEGERDEARTQRQAQIDALSTVQSEKDAAIAKASNELADASQQLTRTVTQHQGEVANARQQAKTARDELDAERERNRQEVRQLNREKDLLAAKNTAIADTLKLRNAADAPDGEVIGSMESIGKAYINIGRRQMLRPGTPFRIFEKTRSGLKLKGHGSVTTVEMDRSEMQITELVDAFSPVVKGDVVANDLYSPNMKRTIYLMGRFITPHTKEEVKRLMAEIGNEVVDAISPKVDLILLGKGELAESGEEQPITETDEYKAALNLSIEMVPVSKVADLLRR